jgi:hypothetical protein
MARVRRRSRLGYGNGGLRIGERQEKFMGQRMYEWDRECMKCLSAFEIDLNACDECPASLQGDGVRENKLQRHFEAFHCMEKKDVLPSAASRVAPMGFHYSSCWVSGTLARLLWRSHPACKLTLRQRLKTSLLPLGKYLPYSGTCKDCFLKTALSPWGNYLPYSVTCKDCFFKTALSPLGKYLPYSVTCRDCFLKTSLPPLGKSLWCCFCRHVDCVLSLHFIGAHP